MRRFLFVPAVFFSLSASLLAQYDTNVSFAPVVLYVTGGFGETVSVATADMNGDGKLDIVAANQCATYTTTTEICQAGSVSILLGNGDGTFQPAQVYASGTSQAEAVAVADLNGDGKPDVVVLNTCFTANGTVDCISTIGVLLGNGDGTLQPVKTYPTAGIGPCCSTTSLAIADVNEDGAPDLLVANGYANNFPDGAVSVMLGNGDGTFRTAMVYDSGGQDAVSVAVSDVNGDGKPDLIVGNNCVSVGPDGSCGSVGVLFGIGDGGFQPAISYPAGGYGLLAIAVTDLNQDGKPDIVVASDCATLSGPCDESSISVLLGNADGTFQLSSETFVTGGFGIADFAVGDMNGDRTRDLVVPNACAPDSSCATGISGSVGVLLGSGAATFPVLQTFTSADYHPVSVALADVNADGKQDIITGDGAATVGVLINTSRAANLTTLVSWLNPSIVGQKVNFTATSSGQSGTPTGAVTFSISGNKPVSVPLTNGQAAFSWTFANAGSRMLTASYSGDSTYAPGVSAPVSQTVNAAVVTIAGSPQQPLTHNASGDYVAQVTVTNTGNVTVSSLQVTVTGTAFGSGSLLSTPPPVANLAPGATAVVTLAFPPSSIVQGATTASLKVSGTYSVTNPSLTGNWTVSFRTVSL